MTDKRKHSRVDSIYLLNYVYLDADGKELLQGMGRTINVSETGIMLEVHVPFQEKNCVDVVVGLKEEMVPIRGKVIFTRRIDNGQYQSGIEFLTIEPFAIDILRNYIQAFNHLSEST